jgi:citrate lyase gamma subunit
MEEENFKESLGKVIGGIAELARNERRETDSYKEIAEADTVALAIKSAEERMGTIVLDLSSVLEDKFGIKINNETYNFLKRLPYEQGIAEKEVVEEQGRTDCWPKSFRKLAEKLEKLSKPTP